MIMWEIILSYLLWMTNNQMVTASIPNLFWCIVIFKNTLYRSCSNRGYSAVAENSSMRVWRASSGTHAVLVPLVYAYIHHDSWTVIHNLYILLSIFLPHVTFLNKWIYSNVSLFLGQSGLLKQTYVKFKRH